MYGALVGTDLVSEHFKLQQFLIRLVARHVNFGLLLGMSSSSLLADSAGGSRRRLAFPNF